MGRLVLERRVVRATLREAVRVASALTARIGYVRPVRVAAVVVVVAAATRSATAAADLIALLALRVELPRDLPREVLRLLVHRRLPRETI